MTTTNQDLLDKVARLEDRIERICRELVESREREGIDGVIIRGLQDQLGKLKGKKGG